MYNLWQDLRYALRSLAKSPGVGTVVVLTLALGIGANVTIFSLTYAVLLRPLPYKNPDRIVQIWGQMPSRNIPFHYVPYPDFAEWKAQSRVFDIISAYRQASMNFTGRGEPRRVSCLQVNSEFFRIGGLPMLHGRGFLPGEDGAGAPRLAVLGHALWQEAFGGDPGVIGRSVVLDGTLHEVVGVLPREFEMPVREIDFYVPITASASRTAQALGVTVGACALLRSGVSLQAAQGEIDTINSRLNAQYEGNPRNARVWGLREFFVRNVRWSLWILMGSVSLVLLIACANAANIMLARAGARRQEVAIRTALGAGRGAIIRQVLTESVVLSVAGGLIGVLLAYWGLSALTQYGAAAYPLLRTASIDGTVLLFSFAISLAAGLVFGTFPALALATESFSSVLQASLREGAAPVAPGRWRSRSVLIVCEVALSVVLLTGAGLLVRSFLRLQAVDLGFEPRGVMTAAINLPQVSYPNAQKRLLLYEELLQRLRLAPEIEAAGIVDPMPLSGTNRGMAFFPEGAPVPSPADVPITWFRIVSDDYFRVLGTPLVAGRAFNKADNQGSPAVAVVGRKLASRFWPGDGAVGRRFMLGGPTATPLTVVGVTSDIRSMNPAQEPDLQIYLSWRQMVPVQASVVARTRIEPSGLAPILRKVLAAIDYTLPLARPMTLEQMVADSISARQVTTLLLGVFATFAVALAAVGVYGVVSYSVAQRTREIGVRRALGAKTGDVIRAVAGQSLLSSAAGVGLGIAASYAVRNVIASELYGAAASDPWIFTGVPVVLAGVAAVAAFLASRRALRIDPIVALRAE